MVDLFDRRKKQAEAKHNSCEFCSLSPSPIAMLLALMLLEYDHGPRDSNTFKSYSFALGGGWSVCRHFVVSV